MGLGFSVIVYYLLDLNFGYYFMAEHGCVWHFVDKSLC